MKITAAIAALVLVAAVGATAIPNPEPRRHRCGRVGQACGKVKRDPVTIAEAKVKRAADAFAEALASSTEDAPYDPDLAARCEMGACYEAKMMTRDIAASVAETTSDPAAYFESLNLEDPETSEKLKREARHRCGHVGQACGKVKRDLTSEDDISKREADPEARHRCGHVGQACGKLRRAAEALAEAVADPEPEPRRHCGRVGQACGKARRDELALAQAADLVLAKY